MYAPDVASARATCEAHGLAAGPDGRCVICRRAEPAQGGSIGGRVALVGLIVLTVTTVVAVGAKLRRGSDVAVAEGAPESVAPAEEAEGEAELDDPPDERPVRGGRRTGTPLVSLPADEPAAAPGALATAKERAGGDGAAKEAREARRAEARTAERELDAAMRSVPVRMYGTSWCPNCQKARAWLRAERISFVDLDVERDESARREHERLNPKGSVPTFDVDGDVLVGFRAKRMTRALRGAAQRRLGR